MAEVKEKRWDLVVIGSGPGGYTAAIRAAQLGMSVAIAERAELGGVCLNWGCIPTKALLTSAERHHEMRRASDFGLAAEGISFDWGAIIRRSRNAADRMNKGVAFLMKKNGIEILSGRARLGGAQGEVLVEGTRVAAKQVLIATGARARPLPGIPFDRERIVSAADAMVRKERPSRLLIVGAGAIGVEFAYFFSSFGTKVTLVEMLSHLLPIEDEEIGKELERSFSKKGIAIRLSTKVAALRREGEGVRATLAGPKGEETVEADLALVAVGVQGNVEDLGLEQAGVHHERGAIQVDARMKTSTPGIWAIGDVVGPPWLAHVAAAEGIVAVETMAGHDRPGIDHRKVPGCTYCHPQVASVGLTEKAARERGYEIKVGRFPMRACGKAVAAGETEGFAKVIVGARYGEILGVHMIGASVTEAIGEASLALAGEVTAEALLDAIHAHPTVTETIAEATANALGEAINI